MSSASWMNQFEIKDTCIEFVIRNVSPLGNNLKIKFMSDINENAPGFYQKHIHNLVKHLI